MKKLPYIRNSRKFYGKYEIVVDDNHIIPCYNYATAVTITKRIKKENAKRKKTRME